MTSFSGSHRRRHLQRQSISSSPSTVVKFLFKRSSCTWRVHSPKSASNAAAHPQAGGIDKWDPLRASEIRSPPPDIHLLPHKSPQLNPETDYEQHQVAIGLTQLYTQPGM